MNRASYLCSVCGGQMHISELTCPDCRSKLTGTFAPCAVCQLPPDLYEFLLTFIRCRGSIKDVEKALGISYPTVRGRLDDLLRALGFGVPARPPASEIIEQLERGEITAEQAIRNLKGEA